MFRNPCKNCIVLAMCKKRCEKIKKYEENVEVISVLIPAILSGLLSIGLLTIIIIYCNYIVSIIVIGSIIFSYGYLFCIVLHDSDFNEVNWFIKVLISFISPWILFGAYCCVIFEDKIHLFIFKYNTRLSSRVQEILKKKEKIRNRHNARI